MAVEVARYIEEKLSELPEKHPDRRFLRGIQQATDEYVEARTGTVRKGLPRGRTGNSVRNDFTLINGDELGQFISEGNMNIKEFSEQTGISKSTISRILNGKAKSVTPPTRERLEKANYPYFAQKDS